jgi:hypothetical protein
VFTGEEKSRACDPKWHVVILNVCISFLLISCSFHFILARFHMTRFKRHSPLKVQTIASHIIHPIGNYTTLNHQEKCNKYGIHNITHAIVLCFGYQTRTHWTTKRAMFWIPGSKGTLVIRYDFAKLNISTFFYTFLDFLLITYQKKNFGGAAPEPP